MLNVRPGPSLLKMTFVFWLSIGAISVTARPVEDFGRVDAVFADWDKTTTPGMSLAVVRDGKIIYSRGYGMASLELGVINKPETVYDIGSISKQFTAAAILLLEHQGRLKLDDDIRTYLPEMPRYERPVTIRQLIHHTSGVRDYEFLQSLSGELTDQGWHTNRDLLELIARQKGLNFTPGEKFQYSNSGYTLLAVIVERKTGLSLGRFAKENIFDPLGMKNTFILENNRIVVKNRARGYSLDKGVFVLDETLNESTGDGAVQTTVLDFALWDDNFYRNRIELPDFRARMEEVGKFNDGNPVSLPARGEEPGFYASGLILSSYRGLRTAGHGGAYVGFRAGYLRFPDQRTSIVICANVGDVNPMDYCHRVADIILEKEFKEPPKPETAAPGSQIKSPAPKISLAPPKLEEYSGDYVSEEIPTAYELRVREGKLVFVHRMAVSSAPLLPEGDDLFNCERLRIKFRRDGLGKIKGFEIASSQAIGLSFRKVR